MVEILDAIDSVLYYPSCLWSWPRPVFISASAWDLYRFTGSPRGCVLSWQNRRMKRGRAFSGADGLFGCLRWNGQHYRNLYGNLPRGPGAVFWMTVMALIGAASSFVECTLAQIYKRKNSDGTSYGGPAYYIEDALHNKTLATAFVVFLLLTYSFGFNLVCSYNVQSTFSVYSFYDPSVTPAIIGAILAILCGACVMGGAKRIEKAASILVPSWVWLMSL